MNTRRTTPLLLAALAGTLVSTASASVIGWNNPAGGAWYATSNWNPQSAPGPGDTASITMAGTYDIGVGNGSPASVGSISLLNPNARLLFDNGTDFTVLAGGIVNNGTILINSDTIGSDRLLFGVDQELISGTGAIVLNAPNYQSYDGAYLNTASGVTGYIGAGQTIQGNGNIYGSFVNQGTIGGGTIEGPQIRGTVQQSNGGRIFVSGQHASILDGTVVGGTIETANNGFVFGRGTGNLQGVTITAGSTFCIDNNNDFGINGAGITNNGTIVVNSDQIASDRLVFRTNNAALAGTGVVNLNAPNYQSYDGAYLNTAPGITATIGAGQTIQGNGNIYGSYINQGTIGGGSIEGPQIRGTVQQNNGGRIFVSGQHASILDGTVINGTIETANGGIVFARGTGSLQGVTITTGSSFFVDNNNDFGINSAGITNNGNIVINSDQGSADRLLFRTDTAIQGVGSVFLNANPSDYNSAQLNTVGTSFGTLASGQTIRGRGTLNGNFLIDGRISPGIPPGSVIGGGRTNTIRANGGSVTLDSGSAVDIELASAGVWDSFEGNSSKSIQPGVAMTVAFLNGYAPGGTAWFDVITAIGSSVSGRFDTLSAPLVPSGPMHLVYFSDRVRLVVCYANCDGSTTAPILNVNDFTCFLNSFAAGDPYANCDASTTPPVLNILDFTCFLNKFAAGCT